MKKSLRMTSLLGALLMVFSLFAPIGPGRIALAADDVEITILHTNDVHARVGVEPYAAALKKQYEGDGKNVMLLSAGDVLHGQTIATLAKGSSIVEIMNKTGYDALSPGNHDFNYGYERLLELEEDMEFPVLGANVYKGDDALFKDEYLIMEFDDVRVGIFGLATPETATKTNPLNVQGITFNDPAADAARLVSELRTKLGCDVVIALVHLGLDGSTVESERSTAVAKVDGIDLVIDGHSHTMLENGKTDHEGAPIVQAYQYGQRIGEVTIKVDDEKNVTVENMMLHDGTDPDDRNGILYDWEEDESIAAIIDEMNEANAPAMNRVIATTEHTLYGGTDYTRTAETNLANIITDAMIRESGADVALTNGGGIRAVITPGDITVENILTVLPFGNFIVTREVTGANIRAALEFGLDAYPDKAGKFPQIAGMKAVFDPSKPAGSRLVSLTMADGTPMDDAKTYTLATNDFMAVGGDGYTMLDSGGLMAYAALDEAVIDYLSTGPEIKAEPEGRLSVLSDKPEPTPTPTPEPQPTPEPKKGWQQDGGKWRYFGDDGLPVTGWLKDGGKWYYLQSDGVMKTGWQKDNAKWYYLEGNGAMKVGWLNNGGKWYYLQSGGAMKVGWVKDNGKWYYLQANGAMKVGWMKDMDTGWWYYLQSSGAMKTSWHKDGNTWYYLQNSGAMLEGWLQEGSAASGAARRWYYLKTGGAMAASERLTIGGRSYRFAADGRML